MKSQQMDKEENLGLPTRAPHEEIVIQWRVYIHHAQPHSSDSLWTLTIIN